MESLPAWLFGPEQGYIVTFMGPWHLPLFVPISIKINMFYNYVGIKYINIIYNNIYFDLKGFFFFSL